MGLSSWDNSEPSPSAEAAAGLSVVGGGVAGLTLVGGGGGVAGGACMVVICVLGFPNRFEQPTFLFLNLTRDACFAARGKNKGF